MPEGAGASLVGRIVAAEARIRSLVRETFVDHSPILSALSGGGEVWLKYENLQHTGSFKVRGALNKILSLSKDDLARGVIASSTGNHGLGVAYSLSALKARGTIFLPTTASKSKIIALEQYKSVKLQFFGADAVTSEAHAREVAVVQHRAYISPYNDLDVIVGQGTIGIELERQCPKLDAVFVSVGGGGLISGIASYLKPRHPDLRIVGCWPENSPALYLALKAGKIVDVSENPTLSDGTAGGIESEAITFSYARDLIDECVLVQENEIADAIRLVLAGHRMAIEGAAGVAVAGYLKTAERYAGQNVAVVVCGGNISYETLCSILC
ncbi:MULTISPECIES: threonine/serine dehydratase [Bradyrhizobium]|uniref:Threonine/serine dehydratase n=1 Tax=Bradyrhizobium frederickii TaxID=2560054 RepID=A0A4Y9NIA6_9BRAD|nr:MULTISPECIES: threonine/serine dehydratase [Bradyrhizobium]RTE87871.1 threonine/serine dehydratase [Bradyrhizobium sp. LVM 105]TFV28619.1 threonine/serine dehydratase [Bradyrhizobium frederickii]TFV67404.1 threonine/serine dehydratase [Bradyrhizobium frederickii]